MKFEDLLIVLLIVVVLFGGSKLPQLGAGLGNGLRNFRRALEGKDQEPPPPSSGKDTSKDGAPPPSQGQ